MQLLLTDSGQPRGAGGAAGAPSTRASRFSSQRLCRLQPAFLLMQQARAAKHWERRSETKAVYLSPLPPVVLRFGPPDQAESPIFALGIFSLVSFRNLYHLVQELLCPSCQVGQQAQLCSVTSCLERSSQIRGAQRGLDH